LQIGGHGNRITQASKVRIVTDYPMPMQVDGEPVVLEASEILIQKKNQANMIAANEDNVLPSCVQSACSC
jgi:hypothetical protein